MISRSVLLRMKNVSDKSCRENQNTHFMFNKFFLDNRAIYGVMWKKHCTAGQATEDNRAHEHFILDTKATNIHSKFVIITALHCNNGCTHVLQC